MNKIIELKGNFEHFPKGTHPSLPNLPKKNNSYIDSAKLGKLINDLEYLSKFWKNNKIIDGSLIQVNYDRVVAKSNRISKLLSGDSVDLNRKIVGAKYRLDNGKIKHSITYYVDRKSIDKTIQILKKCQIVLDESFHSKINNEQLESLVSKDVKLLGVISKSLFVNAIVDSYYVENFSTPDTLKKTNSDEIITTLYNVERDVSDILKGLGIAVDLSLKKISDNTYLLSKDQYNTLIDKAPYIVSMELKNISDIVIDEVVSNGYEHPAIPKPKDEPIVGVIDKPFDKKAYFSEWVTYKNETGLPDNYATIEDKAHGTRVDSIIVDGPFNNPGLEDGCGRFQVKHFGVFLGKNAKPIDILTRIKKIVNENKDIKVWNLSLGSSIEVNDNYISPIAAELDRLQYENDIIFIIAGTNDDNKSLKAKIGDPADSINSIVVNSVSEEKKIANYSRKGPVLSFYTKPDVCYYGGSENDSIVVWDGFGKFDKVGSSYAAPWITRKIAFLIYRMGLSKEIAKAIIIDSTLSWEKANFSSDYYGHGIVPKNINDILSCKDDEIKFYINEIASEYDNFSYKIPVPINNDLFPYVSRATMCYFTKCSRNQGVDYNDVELDLHFGVITSSGIKTINDNKQNVEGDGYLDEETARRMYRKWDNVKIVNERYSKYKRPKKTDDEDKSWGLSIKKTGRFREPDRNKVNYGIVITLKEINGINRIKEFFRLCNSKGWMVHELNVENRNDMYINSEKDISLTD